jgi:hypothetical protein
MAGDSITVPLVKAWKPYDKQLRVIASRKKFILFLGGIGAGKTYTGACWVLARALERKSEILVLGRSEKKDAVGQLLKQIRELLYQMQDVSGVNWIKKFNGSTNVLELLNNSRLTFRGFTLADKLLGPSYDHCWLDELSAAGSAATNADYILDLVSGRLRGPEKRVRQTLVTMTARGLEPVVERFRARQAERCPEHYTVIASSFENPVLDRADVESWCRNMSKRRVDQEVFCRILRPQSAIWPEFGRDHLVDHKWRDHKSWDSIVCIDWGMRVGSVALYVQINPVTKQWVVADELVPQEADIPGGLMSRGVFRNMLRKWLDAHPLPSACCTDRAVKGENNWLRALLAKRAPHTKHLSCRSRAEQSILNTVELVRDQLSPSLGEPRIVFSRSLDPRTRGETPGIVPAMMGFRYEVDRFGDPKPTVCDDKHKHATDALRYGVICLRSHVRYHAILPRAIGLGELEDASDYVT